MTEKTESNKVFVMIGLEKSDADQLMVKAGQKQIPFAIFCRDQVLDTLTKTENPKKTLCPEGLARMARQAIREQRRERSSTMRY